MNQKTVIWLFTIILTQRAHIPKFRETIYRVNTIMFLIDKFYFNTLKIFLFKKVCTQYVIPINLFKL